MLRKFLHPTAVDSRRVVLLALTTSASVAIVSNMKAALLLHERRDIAEDRFVELVVWQVPQSVRGSTHLRYDNEVGKGDHRHVGAVEMPYTFTTPEQLYADFMADVTNWRT